MEQIEAKLCPTDVCIDSRDGHSGRTAVHCVADRRNCKVLGKLLSFGASPNAASPNGSTALHFATGYRCTQALKLLLESFVRVIHAYPTNLES